MDLVSLFAQNLFSPSLLFFILGVVAGALKSDLEIPENVGKFLGIYLMLAIGFKGGVALSNAESIHWELWLTICAGIACSFLFPFLAFRLLRMSTSLDPVNAAAIATHYGSISMVTFITASTFLRLQEVEYAGYIVAIVALMEVPALVSGLYLARSVLQEGGSESGFNMRGMVREIFSNGSLVLLLGAFLIGLATGAPGMEKMKGFLVSPFQGILAVFLLDMGLIVAHQAQHLRKFTLPLCLFGIYMPILGGIIGLLLGNLIGLDRGTLTLFAVLTASASYIAVPAVLRVALPQASPAIYLPMSLAITFPFNVVFGIPLYFALAGWLTR